MEIIDRVAHIVMCRPEKRNSMNPTFWRELPALVKDIDDAARARVIVLSSEGPHFTAGLDLAMFASLAGEPDTPDRKLQKSLNFLHIARTLQDALSVLENARVPILVAVQGGCFGGGVDLITACDIRYATRDAFFCIQETNVGMTADLGTFPRLVKLIPEGFVRDLAYTGRRMPAEEAQRVGLVNQTFEDQSELLKQVLSVAKEIASKAPVAVHGCKRAITYARDHSTQDTLDHIALWNASMLSVGQIMEAISAAQEEREGQFAELPPKVLPFD